MSTPNNSDILQRIMRLEKMVVINTIILTTLIPEAIVKILELLL